VEGANNPSAPAGHKLKFRCRDLALEGAVKQSSAPTNLCRSHEKKSKFRQNYRTLLNTIFIEPANFDEPDFRWTNIDEPDFSDEHGLGCILSRAGK